MFIQDVRRAVRVFRLEPGFATAAVLTLALGIGANTALFAVVEAVLLRPLPYSDAGGLVIVKHRDRATGISKEFIAIGDFVDLRARQRSLESLVGYGGMETTLTGDGEPLRVQGLAATRGAVRHAARHTGPGPHVYRGRQPSRGATGRGDQP